MNWFISVLLITGSSDLPYHEWKETAPALKSMLESTKHMAVNILADPREISPERLAGYDVIVVDYHGPRWGPEAELAVADFVASGKGIVTFHLDSYAFEGWFAWPDIIGATWFKLGHSKRRLFKVDIQDKDHPITRGLGDSFEIDDELYNGLTLKPRTHVLADAWDDPAANGTGKRHPLVWTGEYGKGRTLHLTLGHDLKSLSADGFQKLMLRGTEWAALGEVTARP